MAIDRDATLKKAEKLLRQGKLDGAIAEYVRLVEEQPKDWNSINALGDLFSRAGQIDNAVAQFTRIADYLHGEGFLPKAAALYKKNLRIKSDDEHTLLRLSDIATRQGVLVDAKNYLRQVGERRKARGDQAGSAEVIIRLGSIDPNDAELKMQAARAAQSLEDIPRARALLIEAADAFEKQQRVADMLAALAEALALDPSDVSNRTRLLTGLIAQGHIDEAQRVAKTSDEMLNIADVLQLQGHGAESLEVLIKAADLDAANVEMRGRVVRELLAAGDSERARQYLTAETAGDDPDLLMTFARLELQSNRIDEGRAVLNRLLALSPDRREGLVFVACELADQKHLEAAFACVDLVADAALLEEDWGGAASALNEFVTRVPNQIPALMKLVEICVDGGLESTMYMAQAQLADAYLAAGLGAEARVIAEDLVAREPWVRANIDRFRRALILLGVADPDAIIAERLSGESPFLSTDGGLDMPAPGGRAMDEENLDLSSLDLPELPAAEPSVSVRQPVAPPPPARSYDEVLTRSFDQTAHDRSADEAPTRPPDGPPARRPPAPDADAIVLESMEIDLSEALSGLNPAKPAAAASPPQDVFDDMRSKADRESQLQNAQAQYAAAIDHSNHGRLEQAIAAFEAAARVPLLRFQAGARLGRLHIARGDLAGGVEWLERAAQAPAPTPDDGHTVMFELAETLEQIGESARALAVLLELQADAGSYRDVASRIDRLAKVQARR